MTAPFQLDQLDLLEVAFRANLDYDPAVESQMHRVLLQVRGTLRDALETDDEAAPYYRVDVETYFGVVSQGEGVLKYRMILVVDVNGADEDREQTSYHARVVLGGDLTAVGFPPESLDLAEALRIARANGAALLYGSARQIIYETTLRSAYKATMLPAIRFQDVVTHEEQEEAAGGEPDAAAGP